MRNLKKVLGLVLCLAMMLSIMVVGAGAAFSDQDKIEHTEAVDACVSLNIINGYPDGTFKPNDTIKRSEMTKMICVLLNGGKDPNLGTGSTPFTDVPSTHWAAAYVQSCFTRGIVAGTSATTFNPEGAVKGVEEAKMLLVALGYDQGEQSYVGAGWEVAVNTDASSKGFYEDLEDIDPNAPITREHAAEMIWNALNAYEVEYKNNLVTDPATGALVSKTTVQDRVVNGTTDKITLLFDKYECHTETGIMTSVKLDSDDGTYTTRVSNVGTFDAAKDYSDLMGQKVKTMYKFDNKTNEYTLLGIYPTSDNKVVSALADDIDGITANNIKGITVKYNNKDYDISNNVRVVGPNGTLYTDGTGKIESYFNVTMVDNNKDDRYDYVVVQPYGVAQIDSLSSSKVTLSAKGGTAAHLPGAVLDITKDNVKLYDGAAEDDYAIVMQKAYTVSGDNEFEKAEVVSGEVSHIRTNTSNQTNAARIDGTWYSVAAPADPGDTIAVNTSYDMASKNGFVFDADKTKGNVSAENILYIEKTGELSSGLADGVEAKVWFADGSSQIVKITKYTDVDGKDWKIVKTVTNSAKEKTNAAAKTTLDGFVTNYSLFTYSVKDGEYTVEPVYKVSAAQNNTGTYDALVNQTTTVAYKDGKSTGGNPTSDVDKVTTARFQNDGVFFVKDSDGVKVVNGTTVNAWKEMTGLSFVRGLSEKSNGAQYIAIGAIDLNANTAKDKAANYGYITSKIAYNKEDGTEYANFTMWNGTENVDIKVEATTAIKNALARYAFISFNWADEANKEADTTDFLVKYATVDGTALTSFVEGKSVSFSQNQEYGTALTPVSPAQLEYDLSDDAVIIYVDTKAGEGVSGKLAVAKAYYNNPDNYWNANALAYVVKDSSEYEVEALFVDVSGNLYNDKDGNLLYVSKNTSTAATTPVAETSAPVINLSVADNDVTPKDPATLGGIVAKYTLAWNDTTKTVTITAEPKTAGQQFDLTGTYGLKVNGTAESSAVVDTSDKDGTGINKIVITYTAPATITALEVTDH